MKQMKRKEGKGENRRIRRLRDQIKKLGQLMAKLANEIHRKRVRRKPTNKEKTILAELKVTTKSKLTNPRSY